MSHLGDLDPSAELSPAQALIWASQRLEPRSPHQNMALITYFGEPIDVDRFVVAVDATVQQSDALRTVVRNVNGVPRSTVLDDPPAPCERVRLERNELDEWLDARISRPLDVSSAGYESILIELGNGELAWFMNIHHLVTDAASSANVFNAVAANYHGDDVELPSYSSVWTELLDGVSDKRDNASRTYWEARPDVVPTRLYDDASERTTAAERISIDMSTGRQDKFDKFVDDPQFKLLSSDLSQAVALALVVAGYLARLGNDRVTIGVPVHHRSTKASKGSIGPLVELFPLSVEVTAEDTFRSLHKKVGRQFFALLSNALPGTSPRQDFDVALNVHGATFGNFGSIPATTKWIHPGHIDPHYLLQVQALDYDGSGVLDLALDINHRGATAEQRVRAGQHMAAVFDAMLDDPDRLVHSVPLLDEHERELLTPFTEPVAGLPVVGSVPEVIHQRLVGHGERSTVRTPDGKLIDARTVDQDIAAVAAQLRKGGYGPGDLIGVEMGISYDAVVAIHGIQRAGAAFVPIDPDYPEQRRDHIRKDSGACLVLTSLTDLDAVPVVDERPLPITTTSSDLAYVIYTSGSTGLPKGVPITYEGLAEYLGFAYSNYIDGASPTMPLFTSLSFDLTITTLYLPLLSGGLMTIHPQGGLAALREIADLGLATLIKATPSHLELLARMLDAGAELPELTGLIVGGEAFMTDLAERLVDLCGNSLRIFNEYGPTEAVVGCMIHCYDPDTDLDAEVPIGHPAPGVSLHVLDPFGHDVPIGVAGELHIYRPGMTAGYLGRDDLNAERFGEVAESSISERFYASGDLVRITGLGTMVYLGRVDEQIKVGGIRVEPGEIEHVAKTVPGTGRAVARMWSPGESSESNEPVELEVLALWIEGPKHLDPGQIWDALVEGLPPHSVPKILEIVDEIPLTTNGKVAVDELVDPTLQRSVDQSDGRMPSGATETAIATVWETVLGVDDVRATDDFFSLGGTSMHALEMIVLVSTHFDVHVPESTIFKKRTISGLALFVDSELAARNSEFAARNSEFAASNSELAASGRRTDLEIPKLANGKLPLSAGEESMLYEWRRNPDDKRYNVARVYSIGADVDRVRLDAAIERVVEHHQTLRTSYGFDRTELPVSKALRTSESQSSTQPLMELAEALNVGEYDLVNGPLISVQHLSSSADDPDGEVERGVLIGTHHIVSDAGSLDVLWDQIDLAYRGEPLPKLGSTYAEHAVWQSSRASDPAAVWSPAKSVASLAIRGTSAEPDGYVHRDCPVTASQLRSGPAPTLFANSLVALSAGLRPFHDGSLNEYTITSSVRDHPEIEHVVGYFLNPLPLLLDVDASVSLEKLACSVGDSLASALEHRSVPLAAVLASARERGITLPSSNVMLAVEELAPAQLNGEHVEHRILASGTAVNDLTFFVQVREEAIEIGCEYRGSTIGRANAVQLLDAFADALAALVVQPEQHVGQLFARPAPLDGPPLNSPLRPVHESISSVIESVGARAAVASGNDYLTYRQLDDEARSLAGRLRRLGVEPGDRVALCMSRGTTLVSGIWATWMLGASYVPIDISQPPLRVLQLMSAAGVAAAVSTGEGHPGLANVPTVFADEAVNADGAHEPMERTAFADLDAEAYLIFTSGSTGTPKGVPISHRNLAASLLARQQWYDETVERYLLVSSAGFDSSVAGIFWTLADGGELIIPTEREAHDVDALLDLVSGRAITHGLMVPSLYGAMLDRNSAALTALRTLIVAGEACPPALVERHFSVLAETALINEYGPTEATVWATAHSCSPADAALMTIPIGGPIPGMSAEVVDATDSSMPVNAAGELVLFGPGVAAGYIDEPELSAEGSLDAPRSPFTQKRRGFSSYRTGDLVTRRADGSIEFLGRVDDQLSVGGVRVDPSEVEAVLVNQKGVEACLVDVVGRDLVAFVERTAPVPVENFDSRELFANAALALPATHVPRRVRVVRSLPRNVNGKLDRSALDAAALDATARDATARDATARDAVGEDTREASLPPYDDVAAKDPTLAKVMEIFSAAFDGAPISPCSDFFDLGGDSLRAVAVVSLLENEFGHRVAIGELIDAPTPELLTNEKLGHVVPGRRDQRATKAERARAADRPSDLVEWLRRSGTKQPLVVLPPGGGNLLRYAPLVKALGSNVPVIGIRLPGADARSAIVETIEEQAAVMLEAMDSALHSGPYRLLGWSTGGLLAWEIARLLLARGDEVEGVVLVDTVMAYEMANTSVPIHEKYRAMVRDDGVAAVVSEGAGRLYERANFALARRRYRNARESGAAPSLPDAERQLGPVIKRAAAEYQPVRQDLRLVYVGASKSDNAMTVDPWNSLHEGLPLELITIDGVHYMPEEQCIIGKMKAPELVERLRAHLDL